MKSKHVRTYLLHLVGHPHLHSIALRHLARPKEMVKHQKLWRSYTQCKTYVNLNIDNDEDDSMNRSITLNNDHNTSMNKVYKLNQL